MVENARVRRLSGEETVVGAHQVVRDDRHDDVNIDPAESFKWRAPKGCFDAPFRDDREVDGGGDDREMVDKKGKECRVGEADVDGGCDDALDGAGQAPEVGEQRAGFVSGDEGEAGEEGGEVAEMQGDGVVHADLTGDL